MGIWLQFMVVSACCCLLGYELGRRRNRPVLGAGLGLVLSVFGLWIIVLVPPKQP